MRVVVSVITGLFFSVFVIIVVSFIISFVYEDEVSEIFLKELNSRVEEDIRAGNVDLSLLKKFPSAVVELEFFELYSSSGSEKKGEGSLSFSADEVYFQFDVVDLFTGKYHLDNIYINKAQLNIISGPERTRMKFKKKPSEKVTLNVNKLVFKDLYYSILNNDQTFALEGHTPKTVLSGNVSSSKFDMNVDSEIFVDNLVIDDFPYIQQKNLRFTLGLLVTPDRYSVRSGHIYYEGLPFAAEGSFNREKQVVDLSLRGNGLDVKNTSLYLPWKIKKQLEALPVKGGSLDFFARLDGPVKNGRPEFQADFSLSEGEMLMDSEEPMHITNIAVTGYVSNGRYNSPSSSFLTLNNLHAEWKNNELNCDIELTDFKQPHVVVEGTATLNFGQLSRHFRNSILGNSEGTAYLTYQLNDDMENLDDLDHLIRSGRLTCDATFDSVTMRSEQFNIGLGSGFAYLDKNLYLDSLQLDLNGNEMSVNGRFYRIYENLSDSSEPYRFDLAVNSPRINMSRMFTGSRRSSDSLVNFKFPRKMAGNVKFYTDQFHWKNFQSSKMSGRISFSDSLLEMSQLRFNAFQGQTYAHATLKDPARDTSFLLDSRLYLDHININTVFNTFRDFGQEYITHNHVKGFINGEVELQSRMNKHLQLNKNSLYTLSDFEINDGELVNFEPLIQMANFVSLSELKHVTFSQLSNKITIEDRTIYIPEMDINSSAFDITVSGYHSFDNQFTYQVSLLLSQVLSKKARQNNDFQTEFGNIQEDGVGQTRLLLKLEGTPQKYAIQYDKEGVKNKIKENLRKEKNELKAILNEEFGWFRRDTAIQSAQTGNDRKRFNINWEGNESQVGESAENNLPDDTTRNEREKFIIQWEDDTLD